jgi:predicted Zn-dependent protease
LPNDKAPLPLWRSEGAKAAKALVDKGYAAKEVYAADRAALLYLTETGYDGKALLTWLGRLPARSRPPIAERISLVRERLDRDFRGKSGQAASERFRSERDRGLAPKPAKKP